MKLPLLFCLQLAWASSYVTQKMALAEMPLGLVLVLRYGIATLFFLLAGQLRLREKFSPREWALILFVGVLNFSISPFFQLKALSLSYAIDVSILVAFEPMITALLALFFLKERVTRFTWAAFGIATFGVLVMSGWKGNTHSLQWARLLGNSLFFVSLLCEGVCSTTSKYLTQKYPPFRLIAWMMFAGFIANALTNWRLVTAAELLSMSKTGWMAVTYLALICSVFGYGGWLLLLKKIPLNQLALSLFLQPILGSLLALGILKEKLEWQTLLGALIVLLTLFAWLWNRLAKPQIFGAFKRRTGIAT